MMIDRLRTIRDTVSPLGQARVIHSDPNLYNQLLASTSFLPETASVTERMFCVVEGIVEQPVCKICRSKPVSWNPRTRSYRVTCGPVCSAVDKPIRDRKAKQRLLDEEFSGTVEANVNLFDRTYAADFLRANCLRNDGQLNGNFRTARNFVSRFGLEEFNRVLSDFHINHPNEDFAKYAYDLDHEPKMCEVCGIKEASFDSYKDGYRRTCSAECGNNIQAKIEKIRASATKPRKPSGEDTSLLEIAEAEHREEIVREGKFEIVEALPLVPKIRFLQRSYRFRCCGCSTEFVAEFIKRRCYKCVPKTFNMEQEVASVFSPLARVETNKRSVLSYRRLELDLFFPDHKFAVEIDGIYWHSFGAEELANETEQFLGHAVKHEQCTNAGIRLLSVLDVEWRDQHKRAIFESMIRARLGASRRIFARHTTSRSVDKNVANAFLKENHIEGSSDHTTATGLYHENTLVALMTFGRARNNDETNNELLRYCSVLDHTVVGGASKLLESYAREHRGERMVTRANRRYSTGGLYEKLGFDVASLSPPDYYWVKGNEVTHHSHFNNLSSAANRDFSDEDRMWRCGYRRLWDYGHVVYHKVL